MNRLFNATLVCSLPRLPNTSRGLANRPCAATRSYASRQSSMEGRGSATTPENKNGGKGVQTAQLRRGGVSPWYFGSGLWNDPWFDHPFGKFPFEFPQLPISRSNTPEFPKNFIPTLDIKETPNSYILHAEIPGVKKEDVKIDINAADGYLEIRGKKESTNEEKDGEKLVRVERQFGEFSRRISIPDDVEPDNVTAKFTDGVLEVTVPKPQNAKKKTKTIAIE